MLLEATTEGRRERRAKETRRKILLAALDLFGEREIDAVTMDEIADRADVARGTVFNYFSTKGSLCEQIGELKLELLREAIQEGRIHGPSVGEKISQALRVTAEFPGRSPESCRAIMTRALAGLTPGELPEFRKQMFLLLEEWAAEGQSAGEFRTDVSPCELAGFIMGLEFQATLTWAYGFAHGSLADHQDRVLQLALEGIRTRGRGAG